MSSFWQNTVIRMDIFYFNYFFSTDSVSYFLKMILHISLAGILIQSRMGVVWLHSLKRAHQGSMCLPYGKICTFNR